MFLGSLNMKKFMSTSSERTVSRALRYTLWTVRATCRSWWRSACWRETERERDVRKHRRTKNSEKLFNVVPQYVHAHRTLRILTHEEDNIIIYGIYGSMTILCWAGFVLILTYYSWIFLWYTNQFFWCMILKKSL